MSRRPSISIYDYPEDLNPFNDDNEEVIHKLNVNGQRDKEDKKNFWTFGRSKKKRSNSFSIKSTWNGIFGKKKDSAVERKPAISTVSSTYQRASYNEHPVPPPRLSKDQQEFDEALGTLARRRKYTLDNSSRYSSSLTVNGDPGRIYDGCPQETTVSIMGELTPKPPARRFGQVSPKPLDKIPPLDYGNKSDIRGDEREDDTTPIPPKRGGTRASQRLTVPQDPEDDRVQLRNGHFIDENENMPDDYVFKRCRQDAVRKSNLSINSCISMGSVYASGRKKRRAPLPPGKRSEAAETVKEHVVLSQQQPTDSELPESLDISRVAEDIHEMTKRSIELDSTPNSKESSIKITLDQSKLTSIDKEQPQTISPSSPSSSPPSSPKAAESQESEGKTRKIPTKTSSDEESIEVELSRTPEKSLEIIKDVTILSTNDKNDDEIVHLKRSDSFSVKEEIEKIEKQIKLLESTKLRKRTTSFTSALDADDDDDVALRVLQRGGSRRSLQETRRNFFRDLTKNDEIKIEIKELPREQNEIKLIRLSDPPVAIDGIKEQVKIIELHISEPIKQRPEFSGEAEINPIPKPRRHSSLRISGGREGGRVDDSGDNCGSTI